MKKRSDLPTFDRVGDISDETAAYIIEFSGDIKEWLEFCIGCWDHIRGQIGEYDTDEGRCFEFITGGWSCNELVIGTMEQNHLMWSRYWESSTRGGLHKFVVEEEHKAK